MSAARHPARLPPEALLADVDVERRKASGPGGQHRNKVQTGVRLHHRPTGLVAGASERRSLEDNRKVALSRLRLLLAVEHREPVDLQRFAPSDLWRRRMGGPSLAVNPAHGDVAALLAEALDLLAALGEDLPAAAERLGVSPSRLRRLLRLHKPAWLVFNERRAAAGLPPLR